MLTITSHNSLCVFVMFFLLYKVECLHCLLKWFIILIKAHAIVIIEIVLVIVLFIVLSCKFDFNII